MPEDFQLQVAYNVLRFSKLVPVFDPAHAALLLRDLDARLTALHDEVRELQKRDSGSH